MGNKNNKEILLTPKQRHQELNACINCVHENYCEDVFPFPLNLEECCPNYIKTEFKELNNDNNNHN
jgi:hypothetical protein